jgi:predicted nuclease with RNAse H fold
LPTALGIDVGVAKGLDVVVLDGSPSTVRAERRLHLENLGAVIRDTTPDVVAIDSPPGWAHTGERSRATEREIRGAGIICFGTPSEERAFGNPFYEWMRVGFKAFELAAACGYSRYHEGPVAGTAIEVFPHASAVTLAGRLGPPRAARRPWRREILRANGVEVDRLSGPDQIDAALAALTGLEALAGRFHAPGDPDEGNIVLPVPSLGTRYVREVS